MPFALSAGFFLVWNSGLVALPRLKVIAIEAGRSSVSIESHARLAGALGAEMTLLPRTRPTLDELKDFQ